MNCNRSGSIRFSGILTGLFTFILFFASCEKEGQEFPDEVVFRFVVIDDQGGVVTGAKVSFYDNEGAYQNAISSNNITAAEDTLVTTGMMDSVLLDGGKEYWVLVNYFDNVRTLFLSNVGISDQIEKLQMSSEITAKLFIGPQTGNVSFWTPTGNYTPIKISLGSFVDTLMVTASSAPVGPGNTNALDFSVPDGTYSYFAVSDNGCVWTGQITVVKGGFHPIQLNSCVRGRVTFIAPSYNPIHGPISVSLDNNDFIGTLNGTGSYSCASSTSSAPGTGAGDFITVTRDLNNYTYIAKSQDNVCVWTGSFTISGDMCTVISLPTCP